MHLEGNAVVSVVFHANGTMEVIGLVHGLGHGLDENAARRRPRCPLQSRFGQRRPAHRFSHQHYC